MTQPQITTDRVDRLAETVHDLNNALVGVQEYARRATESERIEDVQGELNALTTAADRAAILGRALVRLLGEASRTAETPSKEPLRAALVAEDDPVVRDLAVAMLARCGFAAVAARDGAEALELIERLDAPVELLLADVVMPQLGGLDLARSVRARRPETNVLFMSGYAEDRFSLELDERSGFLAKPFTLHELELSVAGIGRPQETPTVAEPTTEPGEDAPELTRREADVIRRVAGGYTNDRVAADLMISAETVQSHVRNAMRKLEADSRSQLVATCVRRGLIP